MGNRKRAKVVLVSAVDEEKRKLLTGEALNATGNRTE